MHRVIAAQGFSEFVRIQGRLLGRRKSTHPVQVPIHRGQVRGGHEALRPAQKSATLARLWNQRNEGSDQTVSNEARNGVVASSDAGAPVALVASQHFVAAITIE